MLFSKIFLNKGTKGHEIHNTPLFHNELPVPHPVHKPPSTTLKQHTNRLPMMHPPYRLGKHARHIQHLHLRTRRASCRVLRHRVGHHDTVQPRRVDPRDRVPAEDAVRQQRDDSHGAVALEQLGRARDRVGRVDQVVDEDAHAVLDVADEEHRGLLAVGDFDGAALWRGMGVSGGLEGRWEEGVSTFVDEGKGEVESVGDGRGAFGATGIGADDDGVLVVLNAVPDVVDEKGSAVEVVDWRNKS